MFRKMKRILCVKYLTATTTFPVSFSNLEQFAAKKGQRNTSYQGNTSSFNFFSRRNRYLVLLQLDRALHSTEQSKRHAHSNMEATNLGRVERKKEAVAVRRHRRLAATTHVPVHAVVLICIMAVQCIAGVAPLQTFSLGKDRSEGSMPQITSGKGSIVSRC